MNEMEKYIIVQKSYRIDFNKIEEGYLASEVECYAETFTKAKVKLFDMIRNEGWKRKFGDDITYCTIPVLRNKSADLVMFDGVETPMYEIDQILSERARFDKLDAILNDTSIKSVS